MRLKVAHALIDEITFFAWTGRKRFRALFENKTVAVVGNGPSLAGRELGGAIDHHDIVVRINLVRPKGREGDIGRRTDVRFIGATMLNRHVPYVDSLSLDEIILTTGKNRLFMERLGRRCRFYPPRIPMRAFRLLQEKYGERIKIASADRPPRSGFVFLSLLLSFSGASKITLYGFSLKEKEFMKAFDYAGSGIVSYEREKFENNHCDPAIEASVLRQLARLGVLSLSE